MNGGRKIWLVAFCFGLQVNGLLPGDEIRWSFKPGDKYEVVISQTSTIKTTVNRTKVDVALNLGSEMNWEVVSVKENGNAVIKQSFSRMRVKVTKTAKPTITYDTAEDKEPEDNAQYFAEVYDKLVGIPFHVEMTARGEIVEVVLDKKDMETIREIPESMEARRLFEKQGLMKLVNSGGFVLPEKELEKGAQWPVKKQQKMTFGTADYESIFTYQGTSADDGVADFSLEATAKLKDQPKNPLEKPLVLKNQKQTGTIKFDTRNGYLKSIQVKQEMETEKPFREMKIETESVVENVLKITRK